MGVAPYRKTSILCRTKYKKFSNNISRYNPQLCNKEPEYLYCPVCVVSGESATRAASPPGRVVTGSVYHREPARHGAGVSGGRQSVPTPSQLTVVSTVEPVLKDHPISHKNVVCQDRWSLVTGLNLLKRRSFCQKWWFVKTGGFSWQWSLKTGSTVRSTQAYNLLYGYCKHY